MPRRGGNNLEETGDELPPTNETISLAQIMEEMRSMRLEFSARMEALETRSSTTSILPVAPSGSPQTTPQTTVPQTTSQATQPATQGEDKRWRPEEIGYFDGTGDVFAFTDRLTSTATRKSVKLVQSNLVTLLKDKAFKWYQYELADITKWALNTNELIEPWCQALIERFGPDHTDLMTQLEACRYTRKDAAEKKDATEYFQEIMRITKGLKWKQDDSLMTAFHHFEPGLQRDLDPPEGLTQFIKQVQLRQSAWHAVYSSFGKPRPPDPRQQQQYRPPQQQQYRQQPPRQPVQQHDHPPRHYPPRPAAYWAEQDDDWEYDPPSHSYHAATAFQPSGHTPRRYGNTHDDGGNEAEAHWATAGEDHRCNHEGCTHYH